MARRFLLPAALILSMSQAALAQVWVCQHPVSHDGSTKAKRDHGSAEYGCEWEFVAVGRYYAELEAATLNPLQTHVPDGDVGASISTIYEATNGKIDPYPAGIVLENWDRFGLSRTSKHYAADDTRFFTWTSQRDDSGKIVSWQGTGNWPGTYGTWQDEASENFVTYGADGSLQTISVRDPQQRKMASFEVRTSKLDDGRTVQKYVPEGEKWPVMSHTFVDGRLVETGYFKGGQQKPFATKVFEYIGKGLLGASRLLIGGKVHSEVKFDYQFDDQGRWTRREATLTLKDGKKKTQELVELVEREIVPPET